MKLRYTLAAAASCAVLALFAVSAVAQNKPKLDANGIPCDGVLDGALQCFKKDATVNTLEHPYRTAGESDGRRSGPGRGFTLGEKELIYAAVPGSIVVLDAKHDYNFVKRITFEEKPATLPLESIAGGQHCYQHGLCLHPRSLDRYRPAHRKGGVVERL
jgi:hypothetical protein